MLLIAFGRGAQFILALVMMRVATTLLPPSEMGRMSLFTSAIAFFALFLVNPVGMFINRRLHAWEAQGVVRRYFDYYWAYLVVVAILASFILTGLNALDVVHFNTSVIWLWVLVCGSLLFNTANQTVIPSLNLLGFRGWFIGLTLATVAAGFMVSVALAIYFHPRAEFWLLGLLIGQILLAGIGGKVFFDKLSVPQVTSAGTMTQKHIGVLFGFAWPVSIAVGMNWVQTQSYRFFMENTQGLSALGLFVAGYGISAGLIAGFESILTTYFQPRFYKSVSSENSEEQAHAWASYAAAILPATVLLACFIIVMAPDLTRVLLGARYQTSAQYVVWGVLAESIRVIASVYSMATHARMKTHLLLIPNLTGALISLALLTWLTPILGAIGVGIALLLSGFAMIVTLHFTVRRDAMLHLPYRRILYGVIMGGGLVVGAVLIRRISGSNASLIASILSLGISGIFFVVFQYFLLKDAISKAEIT